MANFQKALNRVLLHEGGYVNDPDDRGGETYKGIARNIHPKWTGWLVIDSRKILSNFPGVLDELPQLQQLVAKFYYENFWLTIQGDRINSQLIAESIFDFCVNAGIRTGVSIAQHAINVKPDGIIGPVTLQKLNSMNMELFLASFTVAKIARYVHLVKIRPVNQKFFFGWVRRAIGDI